MKYDIMMVGPATRDRNIDFTGRVVDELGGAAYFGAYAVKAAGAKVFAAIKNAPKRS